MEQQKLELLRKETEARIEFMEAMKASERRKIELLEELVKKS